jgi:hypothetical protein
MNINDIDDIDGVIEKNKNEEILDCYDELINKDYNGLNSRKVPLQGRILNQKKLK